MKDFPVSISTSFSSPCYVRWSYSHVVMYPSSQCFFPHQVLSLSYFHILLPSFSFLVSFLPSLPPRPPRFLQQRQGERGSKLSVRLCLHLQVVHINRNFWAEQNNCCWRTGIHTTQVSGVLFQSNYNENPLISRVH